MIVVDLSRKKPKTGDGHGGKRPGSGRPKGSKNKASTGEKLHISELAKEYAPMALATLAEIAERGESEAARVSAANALLDRGYGRARQSMEMTGKDGKDLIPETKGVLVVPDVKTPEEWEQMIAAQRGDAE